MKKKKYWAGFCGGKLFIQIEEDNYGFYNRPSIFATRKDARKRFQDVRCIEIKEIKT